MNTSTSSSRESISESMVHYTLVGGEHAQARQLCISPVPVTNQAPLGIPTTPVVKSSIPPAPKILKSGGNAPKAVAPTTTKAGGTRMTGAEEGKNPAPEFKLLVD